MVLCCFTHSLVWPCGLGVFVWFCCTAILWGPQYHTEMIQSYHLLRQFTAFTHELVSVTLLLCSRGLVFCFGFGWVVFCWFCVFVFWFFLLFVLCVGLLCFSVRFCDGIVTGHRTMYRSFISSLLRPLNRRRPAYAIINQLIPICNSQ